jgi:long-chain acyl-CoA synthetase
MAEKSFDRQAAIAEFIGPGRPYEMTTAAVDGTEFRVFANAPENLCDLYRSGLEFADRDFFVYQGERYSYQTGWRLAAQVANQLLARGVQPGDRVGIALRNYPEWIWAFMGITSAGAIAVAMNAWWSGEELLYGIEDSGLDLLFVDRERLERVTPFLDRLNIDLVTVRCRSEEHSDWASFLAEASAEMPELGIAPDTNALIIYTSGYTSRPKGVLSTHRAIIHALLGWESVIALAVGLSRRPVQAGPAEPPSMLLAVPLFHVNGLHVQLLQSFRQGRKLVGMYKWDVEEALRLIEAERITALQGVPTMAWEVIRSPHLHHYDTSSLAYVGGGGAAMAPEHARRIGEHLGRGVPGTGYGMTETNALGTTVAGKALLSRPRTCGRPAAPLVSIKIVDELGDEVPRGQSGEIWIHGAMNFRGYWNNPEATLETLSDGWVHTGDIGHMDHEDYVFITDRKKDMVIRGGENIGCQEVEAVLYDHPGVSECAVFGVPDERLGETLAAVIMPKPGAEIDADGVKAHVAEHLAHFKVPEHVWLQRDLLPRIASGKIYKRALREQAIRALHETEDE